MRVLLIEDDMDLAATLGDYLEAVGHEVDFAYTGRGGAELAAAVAFDVVILDIGLPDIDGLEVCRRIRTSEHGSVPVLMLTARDTLDEKVSGFDAGADDYVLKPFEMTELLVRLGALDRRAKRILANETIRVADLVIEPSLGTISRAGKQLDLHRIGAELLTILARQSPRLVPREELERAIWGGQSQDRDLLRSHLYLVRQVVDRPFDVALIQTIRGRGLRLAHPAEESE